MNFLLRGYFDRNFGDDIMIQIIANYFDNHNFYISEPNKEVMLPFRNTKNIFSLSDYENVKLDAVLRVTGSGFALPTKNTILYTILNILSDFRRLRLPKSLSVIGCNIGPFMNKFAEFIAKLEIKKYCFISTREKYSYEYIKKNCPQTPVYLFPDIVFSLPDDWLYPNTGEGCLGISALRRLQDNMNYYLAMSEIADDFIEKNHKKVLLFAFDMDNENDISAAYTIKALAKHKDYIEIIVHDDNGDNIISNLARCSKILAVRFHSVVMALKMNIAFVPIVYSNKTANMLDDLNYTGDKFLINDLNKQSILKIKELLNSDLPPFPIDNSVCKEAENHAKFFKELVIDKL